MYGKLEGLQSSGGKRKSKAGELKSSGKRVKGRIEGVWRKGTGGVEPLDHWRFGKVWRPPS